MPQLKHEKSLAGEIREISKLLETRDAINRRLVELLASVRGLSLLLGEDGPNEQYVKDLSERILQPAGVREAITFVLRTSPEGLRPVEIRDELVERGYDLRKYTFPMAVIHNALKDLIKRGVVAPIAHRDGTKSYAFRPATRGRMSA